MKVIILQGPPASGKSTWAIDFCKKNQDWFRVSRDDIRNMRGQYWIPKDENLITDIERKSVEYALSYNKNVIIDAMNLNITYLQQLKKYIKSVDPTTEISIKKFYVDIEIALDRNKNRPNPLDDKVIRDIYNKYFPIKTKVLKQDKTLPSAIIVDVDGTIAIRGDRSPFDWDKVDIDTPNTNIIDIVNVYESIGIKPIFLSGRSDVCYDKTYKWIQEHLNVDDITLIMRKDGDNRKDSIVKTELFNSEIKDKYYIRFVLDDRNQVVDTWRKDIGLDCLQVNYGDF